MYTPAEEPTEHDVQARVGALLTQSLALLDEHNGPLALRARVADLLDDLAELWT